MDLSGKWPGLNLNLLVDIYSVHKALMFGQFKFENYTKNDFFEDIKNAEKSVFRRAICSQIIEKHQSSFQLSFHPSFVINDDIFKVMAFHFTVSALVNRLDANYVADKELKIRSFVVPEHIISIYDSQIPHDSSIENIDDHLKSISPSTFHYSARMKSDINNVEEMTQSLTEIFDFVVKRSSGGDIVMVLNRRKVLNDELNDICIFECGRDEVDKSKVNELNRNYFMGFEFRVWMSSDGYGDGDDAKMVRSYLRFGDNQRLRFYPEHLLWIVPRLFARSDKMTVSEMMKRLYAAEYKWGWRVPLDDPVFNQFYHIITRYEHITNNYNRRESVSSAKRQSDCGLRDHLEHEVHQNINQKLGHFVEEQALDSDAILEDSLAAKRVNDAKNSNIFWFLNASGLGMHFRAFRHSLLRYQGTVCCAESILPLEECPWIDNVISDLQRLRECDLEIDATNFWNFELESIVSSWSHILSVHDLLSDDDDQKESNQKIRNYILQRVQCGSFSKCRALKAQRDRRRETKREERIEVRPDAVTAQIEALEEALFAVHCRIFHKESELNRSEPKEEDLSEESRFEVTTATAEQKQQHELKHDEEPENAPVAIDFGRSVLRWLQYDESPRFKTLRIELLRNPKSTIDAIFFDRLQRLSAALSIDNGRTVDETLGLKAYSDTNDFQAALSKAHWNAATEEDRRSFYHWAMTLYRVHLRSAAPIPPATASGTKPRPLWTGLNQLLTLGQELASYYGPLSTTTSFNVATGFSKGKGQIYKFISSYANPLRCTLGIDMETISCYPQEKEMMLYHSVLPIQSTTTETDDTMALVNHFLFSLQARTSAIVHKDAFFKKLGINWTVAWIPLILSHKLLVSESKRNGMTVLHRLAMELRIGFFKLVYLLRGDMFVDEDSIIRLRKTSKISSKLLSSYTFTVNFGKQFPNRAVEYTPKSANDFNIPAAELINSISDSIVLSVFCKANDESVHFVKIHSLIMNHYYFTKTTVSISDSISVRAFDHGIGVGGSVLFSCPSDILINPQGAITLLHDSYRRNMECSSGITIISEGKIKNMGILQRQLTVGKSRAIDKHNELKYEQDFDQNGVFWALGSNFGRETYRNPVTIGKVAITTSPMEKDSKSSHEFIGTNKTVTWTQDVKPSFFSVNLKQFGLQPTAYTLRHFSKQAEYHLTSWEFQGSNDGIHWIILRKHQNETSLREASKSNTWHLDKVQDYYSYFRIWVTGPTDYGKWNLACSGMEIYGDLCKFRGDRSISLVAPLISNDGLIQFHSDDDIHVICNRFENTGSISPEPDILIVEESEQVLVDHLLHAVCRESVSIPDAGKFCTNVGVKLCPDLVVQICSHELLFEETEYKKEQLWKRLAKELNIDIFCKMETWMNRLGQEGAIDDVTVSLFDEMKQQFELKLMFGNKAKSSVIDCDFHSKSQSQIFPLDASQSDTVGLRVFIKPRNDITEWVPVGRFATNVYDLRSAAETTMVISEPMKAPTRTWYDGLGGELVIKQSSDITISSDGAIITDSKHGATGSRMAFTMMSSGNIVNEGIISSNDPDANKDCANSICLVAEGISNRGTIHCSKDTDTILIICRQYENTGITKPVPEIVIGVNPFDGISLMIQHILSKLCSMTTEITLESEFYRKYGFILTPTWIPNISSEDMLFMETCFERKRVWERLGTELNVDVFRHMHLLRQKEGFDGDVVGSLLQEMRYYFDVKIVFGNDAGSKVMECDIDPKTLSKCVPLDDSQPDVFGLSVLVKPRDGLADFIKLGRFSTDVYELESINVPLIIDQAFNVPLFGSDLGMGGNVLIKSSSDVTITCDGSIVTDGLGPGDNKNQRDAITIISDGVIVIDGTLRCEKMNGQQRGGRSICLVAHSIVNEGNIQCESDTDSIRIICNKFENSGTLIPGPDLVICSEVQPEQTLLMVNHLIYALMTRSTSIADKEAFYRNLGVKWTSSWIPSILSHELLFAVTKCNGKTIIDRLGKELQIPLFELLPLLRHAMFVDDDCVVRLRKTSKLSTELLSTHSFAVNFGDHIPSESKLFKAKSAEDFMIPVAGLMDSITDSIILNVFCKANDGSVDFVKIHSLIMKYYNLKRKSPLNIVDSIRIPLIDPDTGAGGSVLIKSPTDIIISPPSAISCDYQSKNDELPRTGITMLSNTVINNQGILQRKMLHGKHYSALKMKLLNKEHIEFKYEWDFDQNGVFWALGTNFGIEKYQNPATIKKVLVVTSPMNEKSEPSHGFIGRKETMTLTQSVQSSFFSVHLDQLRLKPSAYTLRHYKLKASYHLTNWEFQGSHDGEQWTVLRKHENETSLKGKSKSYTWHLDNVQEYYSSFRILMTGKNSDGSLSLCCSGMELYGDLYHLETQASISLAAPAIVNHGTIRSNARVHSINICCNRFENTGSIYPEPEIVISADSALPMLDHSLLTLCRQSETIENAEEFYQSVGVKLVPERIPLILSHAALFDKTAHRQQTICKRLATELNLQVFRVVLLLHNKAAFDGDVIISLLQDAKREYVVNTMFGNAAGSSVLECDIDRQSLLRCVPLDKSQSKIFGITVLLKPRCAGSDSDEFVELGRFTTSAFNLKSLHQLSIDQILNVPLFDGKIYIKSLSDINISGSGGIKAVLAEPLKCSSAKDRMLSFKTAIKLVSDGNVTNNGSVECAAPKNVNARGAGIHVTAESFSNNGAIDCDLGIGCIQINCCQFLNTGSITHPPDIIIKENGKNTGNMTAVWSKSEKRIEMTVYDHRGHNSGVDWRNIRNEHHPKNSLIDDGVSAYESDGSLSTEGDWIIYKLSETMKPSRIIIRGWSWYNSIKSIALWIGNDDGTWFKMCNDITGINVMDNRDRKPQKFELASIASDEQLLTEGADLLMFEILENHGHEKLNTFASFQMFGYPLAEVVKS